MSNRVMMLPSGRRPIAGLIPRLPLYSGVPNTLPSSSRGICICTLSCVSEAPSVSGAGACLPPLNVGIVPVGNKPNSTGFGASLPMRRAISASMLYLPVEPSCVRGVRGTPRRFFASSKANLPRAPAAPTAPNVPRVPSPPMPGPPVSILPKRSKRPDWFSQLLRQFLHHLHQLLALFRPHPCTWTAHPEYVGKNQNFFS